MAYKSEHVSREWNVSIWHHHVNDPSCDTHMHHYITFWYTLHPYNVLYCVASKRRKCERHMINILLLCYLSADDGGGVVGRLHDAATMSNSLFTMALNVAEWVCDVHFTVPHIQKYMKRHISRMSRDSLLMWRHMPIMTAKSD